MVEFRGKLFVLSAPSGGGKSTVIQKLRERDGELSYSVSATTRPPRKGERDGVNYFFLDDETFRKRIEEDAFLEWARVHGYYYGTFRSEIDRCLSEGKRVLLDIDVQGGLHLKRIKPDVVLIFLLPPSLAVLKRRLQERKTDSLETVAKRVDVAKREIKMADQYDYQIVNNKLDSTLARIQTIIRECSKEV